MPNDRVYPGAIVMLSPEEAGVVPTYYVAQAAWTTPERTGPAWDWVLDAPTGRLACWHEPGDAVELADYTVKVNRPAAVVIAASRPIGSGAIKYGLIAPPDCTVIYLVHHPDLAGVAAPGLHSGRQALERLVRAACHAEQAAREREAGHVRTPAQ